MPNKTNSVHVKLENTKISHFLDINQEKKKKNQQKTYKSMDFLQKSWK